MLWPDTVVALLPSLSISSTYSSSSSSFCFHRHGAIVNLAVVLQLVAAALPPGAEDEIVLIEHLPGRQVHLQDFFWTGAEDAPPWLGNDQLLTLYETRAMNHHHQHHHHQHEATVYVPGSENDATRSTETMTRPIDCPSCPVEPTSTILHEVDQDIGVLIGNDPGPRYWLLTVLKPGESVPSKIELRLARLYKAAFTRQQQKHLGLLEPLEYRIRRNFPKRQIISENQTLISQMTELSPPKEQSPQSQQWPRESRFGRSLFHMRPVRFVKNRRTLPIIEGPDTHHTDETLNHEVDTFSLSVTSSSLNDTTTLNELNDRSRQQLRSSPVDVGLVQVRMQNTTLTENGATKLVYTVHLGGKPVPADTAAKDMALLSAQEVALELGAPVIIQSEPYLKESRPLALSRKRDAWLLIGASSLGIMLLLIVIVSLLIFTKRKRSQSAVSVPNTKRILAKDVEDYVVTTTPGIDNTAYTSETEARTEATSGRKRATPGTLSRTPGSQDTLEADRRDAIMISDNELETTIERRGQRTPAKIWDNRDNGKISLPRSSKRADNCRPRSLDSPDSAVGGEGRLESLESLEKGFGTIEADDAMGSPHSYLSMPSCKQFPNMRSVEPLSKVLEPVVVKHLDLELDSPEMNKSKKYNFGKESNDFCVKRLANDYKDSDFMGTPIIWDLRRKKHQEAHKLRLIIAAVITLSLTVLFLAEKKSSPETRETRSLRRNGWLQGVYDASAKTEPTAPAQDTILESGNLANATEARSWLVEDSSILGRLGDCREQRSRDEPSRTQFTQSYRTSPHKDQFVPEIRGKSAHVSSIGISNSTALRPRTSLPLNGETIPETGHIGTQPRSAWGSRPLSAGPFHRPNLPEVDVTRVLADQTLRPEDPAVPLITSIKSELGKFSY